MLHLLRGISPASMSRYPFKPVFLETQELHCSVLQFPGDFPATLLPGLGAFVGADLSAGLLATGMLYDDGPALLVDVGTNGEILLKHAGGITGCATAAGPAFEGGRLRSGMRAATGAISHLRLDSNQPLPVVELIGTEETRRARGICGSAYIDFLAEGLRAGLLNSGGRFQDGTPWQILDPIGDDPGRVFPIDPKRSPDVVIAETDIAELLQAKAAICGGVPALLEEAEVAINDVKRVYLAGGFGLHLNVRNALDMGLLPPFAKERVSVAGNSSLAGSYLTMLDPRLLQNLREAIADAEMLELNQIASFEDFYISSLHLGPPDLD
jgi:uncharacterized 2Fe-2S/4Fe-4S cluster protein (DUF4445 family)